MKISVSIEDQVVKEISERLSIPLNIVEKVDRFQWKSVNKATHEGKNIEVTDLFTFKIRTKVLRTLIENCERMQKCLIERENTEMEDNLREVNHRKIAGLRDKLSYLRSKLTT